MQAFGDEFWFMEDPEGSGAEKIHENLFSHVRAVEEAQKALHLHTLYNAKLAFNRVLPSLNWGNHIVKRGSHAPVNMRHENLVAQGLQASKSLIGKMRPKATPVPRDANWSLERQAKYLDRWLQTVFQEQQVYTKMQWAFLDCCWAPIGALYTGRDERGIYCERVFPDEIVVDQTECVAEREPIQVHRRRLVPKVTLKAMYPEFEEEIDQAAQSNHYTTYRSPSGQQVVLIESWQLALPGQEHGKRAVVIESATLEYEDYKRNYFPFIFLRYEDLPTGFYGRSQAEIGAPFQLRHNELNQVIQRSQDLVSVPRIFAEKRSRIRAAQFDNDIAKLYIYDRTLPTMANWTAVNPELYQQRSQNRQDYFDTIGINPMTAQAKTPDGVRYDSSKALREANFKQTERFQPQADMLEQAYLRIAEHFIDLGIEEYGDREPPEDITERTIEDEIDWKLLGRPGVKYSLKLQASSLNNLTPAAREDQLNNWGERGLLTPAEYKGLLGHPDLDEQESLWAAGVDDIKAVVEQLDKGEAPQPDPLQNLQFGISYVHMTYLKRKRQLGVPEDILQGYRDWVAEAQAIMEGLLQEPPPPAQDHAAMQAQAQQTAQNLDAPVGPDGMPLPAMYMNQ